ncbi:MAG: preprotein translocase subunit SecG [Woeseiaceae bacterium]|nr:preprotein translocase subunit SecG [Woeseiaceae bacterium]
MSTTQTVILIAHTVIAILIIVLVLLQRGKGADAGAAFGSGASGTVFGARGSSNFFSRATAVMATVFFVSSLTLAYLSSQRAGSVDSLLEDAAPVEQEAPAATDEAPELPAFDDVALEPAPDDAEALPELESAPEDVPQAEDDQ